MKKAQSPPSVRELPSVMAFADAAGRFCKLVERRSTLSRRELVTEAQGLLAELYSQGLVLLEVEPKSAGAGPRALTPEEWWGLFSGLRDQLRDYDSHWVADPQHESPANPGESSLSDDIADIYRDLKSGLLLWEASEESKRANSVWEWREGFRNHWGEHALHALRRIHSIVYEDQEP